MSDLIGSPGDVRSEVADIAITIHTEGSTGVNYVKIFEIEEVAKLIEARATAEIVGDVDVSVHGPASASKATNSTACIVPTDLDRLPDETTKLWKSPHCVALRSSLYNEQQQQVLGFHTAINHNIKPAPLLGRQPALLYAWTIVGGATGDKVVAALNFKLKLSGVDYVNPW